MPVDYIFLNKKKIAFDELKSGSIKGGTAFEVSTLAFCKMWLNSQDGFELRTSGSTGEPKTIAVSRKQMCLSAKQTINFFRLSVKDSILVCLNTAFIAGIMMLVRGFESGATIIAVEPSSNPLTALGGQIDFLAIVPLQLQNILDHEESRKKLENCRATIVGGAPVSVKLENNLRQSRARVYATFGMTETLTHFALRQLNPAHEEFFTTFKGVTIGEDSRECLTVSSSITKHETLFTNDLVKILSPDTFKWLGRIDNVINSGGVKLQIEQIETKISRSFEDLGVTNRFFVCGRPDSKLGEEVVLIVESKDYLIYLNNIDWSKYLAKYEIPKEIIYCQQFNETPTGKINRGEIIRELQIS